MAVAERCYMLLRAALALRRGARYGGAIDVDVYCCFAAAAILPPAHRHAIAARRHAIDAATRSPRQPFIAAIFFWPAISKG